MIVENGFMPEMTRREFVTSAGGVLLGALLLSADVAPLQISGPANPDGLKPAVRLDPPKPPAFNPWEAGETIYEVPNDQRLVAFRIDDGPWPLSSHETQAIFNSYGIGGLINPTVIAQNVRNFQEGALEYVANGNVLINHSVTHQYVDSINAFEIGPADDIIEAYTGQRPELYAVPGLGEGPHITAEATRLNKPIISTRVFVGDTDPATINDVAHIVGTAKSQIKPGSIIVLHPETASHKATRAALPAIIEHVLANFIPVQMKTLLYANYTSDGVRISGLPVIRKQNFVPGNATY